MRDFISRYFTHDKLANDVVVLGFRCHCFLSVCMIFTVDFPYSKTIDTSI
jgi:hypothetical protein